MAVCAAAACWLGIGPLAGGAEPARWLTGEAFRAKLAEPQTVFWQDAPLRKTLEKFCRAQRIAVLIDRRVDPGQKLNLGARGVPVRDILQQVAEDRGLGLALFGPVAYLGPPEYTARLRTLAEIRHQDVRRLSAGGGKLVESKPLAWDDFARPRELLERLAAESGIEIRGLDQIPHDLWAAADLPALPLVDRLTLIAGQFDLTLEVAPDGRRVALVPIGAEVALVRSYPAGHDPAELVAQWQALAPEARFKVAAGKIYVKGRLEDLEQIESARQPGPGPAATPRPPAAGGETRFSGRVVNKPLGEVLKYVGTQFDLDLKIDRQALARSGVSLDRLISFRVKDATVDELLKAVLEPAGCTFRRRGRVIEIDPAE